MDPAVGQAGLQPPTSRNPMEPHLSLPYKFEEEESRKEKLKERRRRREKPLPELILDAPLSTRYTHISHGGKPGGKVKQKINNRERLLMQIYKRERKIGKLKITNSWRCILLLAWQIF
jgi:hypothetical protein